MNRRQIRSVAWAAVAAMFLGCLFFASLPAAAQSAAAYTWISFAGFAGAGSADGVGSEAQFNEPDGVAVDTNGNVYVADTVNNTVRKITSSGVVTTIAGKAGFGGILDGTNGAARLSGIYGITIDSMGNLYVTDAAWIRKITPHGTNWVVTTIAGGSYGSGDGTNGNAQFNDPFGIADDAAGNLYVADAGSDTIRKIAPVGADWVVTTIAGSPGSPGSTDGTNDGALFTYPAGVAVDPSGNVYVSDNGNSTIRKLTQTGPTNWVVSTIAGSVGNPGYLDGTNRATRFNFGGDLNNFEGRLTADANGNLYAADTFNETVRKITPAGTNWVVTTLAGNPQHGGYADATGTNALFDYMVGIAADNQGNLFLTDNDTVRKVNAAAVVSTVAGAPTAGSGSGNGAGSTARFNNPYEVAVDAAGNVYVADTDNSTVREITSAGQVSTLAGLAGQPGSANGAGSDARFSYPQGVATDSAGNVYVADTYNHTIRRITGAGVVSTMAGLAGQPGHADGTNSVARFENPRGVAVDTNGNVYVADSGNDTIRKMAPVGTNWVVTTIAGSPGIEGSTDGTNSGALFGSFFALSGTPNGGPSGVAIDGAGNLYVADPGNGTIRKITPEGTNWVVTTIAGHGPNYGGADVDGTGTNALLGFPENVAVDNSGNLYVADDGADTIRKITPMGGDWVVRTIGGSSGQMGSVDGAGRDALFSYPCGVAVDGLGNVYVADAVNNKIRLGVFTAYAPAVRAPFTPPPMNNQLVVTLLPPEANGQWRFPWELAWRDSGTAAVNLATGIYPVEFRDVAGYLVLPPPGPVAVSGGTVELTNFYYPTIDTVDTNSGGSLTVNIQPSPPAGAGWRFLGDTNSFYPPGFSGNVLAGNYLVEFAPVPGFATPATISIQVAPGVPTVISITYLLASPPPAGANLPEPVPSYEIGDLTDYPFGFNGQLQTDVGDGSGVAVQTNVVLTAAHMIFNDQTLSYVSQAYWFSQQETGEFAPEPLPARSWYVLSGYAAQRTHDVLGGLGPDQSSPQSRDLDVAALYFLKPVANGGYGGYLPSDTPPNQWLTSGAQKMLVGYPVDGSSYGDFSIVPGRMYQTAPRDNPLSAADDPTVSDQQVYIASWFLSYPGNSGGPLYVQFNGYYYPAGVYIGTLFDGTVPYASAVRAIDSVVVNLIAMAAALGDTATNNSGGGVITVVPSLATSRSHPAYLLLQLGPPAAVQAGAAWKLAGQSPNYYSTANPSVQEVTTTNALALQFKPLSGWNLPTNQTVTLIPGVLVTNLALYTATSPLVTLDLLHGLQISGTAGTTYQIQSNSSLTGNWIPFTTNILNSSGTGVVTNHLGPGFYRALWLTN